MAWLSLSISTQDKHHLHVTKRQQTQVNNNLDIRNLESLYFSLTNTHKKSSYTWSWPHHSYCDSWILFCLNEQNNLQEDALVHFESGHNVCKCLAKKNVNISVKSQGISVAQKGRELYLQPLHSWLCWRWEEEEEREMKRGREPDRHFKIQNSSEKTHTKTQMYADTDNW